MIIGVYHLGFHPASAPNVGQIVQVDMAVNQIPGFENLHKPEESLKTPVADIFFVVYASGRRMCQKNIRKTPPDNSVIKKFGDKLKKNKKHLKFGVLVRSPVVTY
jgi:hypothetical protein